MENLVIEKQVKFYSTDYSDSLSIETLKIHVTPTDVENIKKAMEFIKNNKLILSVNVTLDGKVEYLDEDDNEFEDWEVGLEKFIVYSNTVSYYAQHKLYGGDQIGIDGIYFKEFGIE